MSLTGALPSLFVGQACGKIAALCCLCHLLVQRPAVSLPAGVLLCCSCHSLLPSQSFLCRAAASSTSAWGWVSARARDPSAEHSRTHLPRHASPRQLHLCTAGVLCQHEGHAEVLHTSGTPVQSASRAQPLCPFQQSIATGALFSSSSLLCGSFLSKSRSVQVEAGRCSAAYMLITTPQTPTGYCSSSCNRCTIANTTTTAAGILALAPAGLPQAPTSSQPALGTCQDKDPGCSAICHTSTKGPTDCQLSGQVGDFFRWVRL